MYITSFAIAKSDSQHIETDSLFIDPYVKGETQCLLSSAGGIYTEFIEQKNDFKNIEKDFAEMKANAAKLEKELEHMKASLEAARDFDYSFVIEEAEKIIPSEAELAKFETQKLDVAMFEYENGVNYQIDIYDHGKKLTGTNILEKTSFAGI